MWALHRSVPGLDWTWVSGVDQGLGLDWNTLEVCNRKTWIMLEEKTCQLYFALLLSHVCS